MNRSLWPLLQRALLIILPALAGAVHAQPFSHNVRASAVENASLRTEPGTVWISAVGYGANDLKAQRDAERAMFEALLFRGLPGSTQTLPLVPDEQDSRTKHADFYREFLDNEGFRPFVMNTASLSGLTKMKKGGKKLESRALIDLNGLRRHLEQNQIIRKFGL